MIYPISADIIRVNHRLKRDYVKENEISNIVIALYTTAEAQLTLYRYMKMVAETPGCEIGYTDTDSVNFIINIHKVFINQYS
jgi:predicted transcriptional regulator